MRMKASSTTNSKRGSAGSIKAVPIVLLALLLFMSAASGCSFIKDSFAPEPSVDPSAAQAPESIEFKGFVTVAEIPIGAGEGCIKSALFDDGSVCLTELRAIGDDEFIILDSKERELLFVDAEGIESTLRLENCADPERIAYDNGTIAVLDNNEIFFMNESGEVLRRVQAPPRQVDYYSGISLFDFADGRLNYQMYSDKAYVLYDNGFSLRDALIDINMFSRYAVVIAGGRSWTVRFDMPPVVPVAIRADRLAALTYDDNGAIAGLYFAERDLYAVASIDMDGLICYPATFDLAMSPSGRVYLLTCYEDRVVISELLFG